MDIYIRKANKMVEVKSKWTYAVKLDSVHEKAQQCRNEGYDYEIWIYDGKGQRVDESDHGLKGGAAEANGLCF